MVTNIQYAQIVVMRQKVLNLRKNMKKALDFWKI